MEITLGSSLLKNSLATSLARTLLQTNSVFHREIGQVACLGNSEEGLMGVVPCSVC